MKTIARALTLADSTICYKITVYKIMCHWHNHIQILQWKRIECPEIE